MPLARHVLALSFLTATPTFADDYRSLWKACKSAEKSDQLVVCREKWDALEADADPESPKYWAARARLESRILRMMSRAEGADEAANCAYAERAMVTSDKAMTAEAILSPNSGLILKLHACRDTYPMPEWGVKFFN